MSEKSKLDRRGFVTRGLAVAGATLLGGCEGELYEQHWVKRILSSAETLTRVTQRALIPANALAREYEEADISTDFKANGSTDVDDDTYRAHVVNGFADWKLRIGGLVEQPLSCRLQSSAPCRRARRSPATIALRVGAASANGPACR